MTARSTLSVSELQSPRLAVRGYSAESRLTEHADAIEFKWERFDRSNVAPQGSSSPLCAHLESEETFWSQPAMIAINADDPTTAGQPVNASRAIDSSRIPSPAWNPDSARGTSGQHVADLASSFMQSTHPQGDEEDSPFVWILPPRDQPVSTPRRTGKKPLASISDVEMQSYNGGKEEGNQRTSSESNLGSAPTKRARGSPFAPAPGVYISPLQVVQDAPCGDSAIFSPEIDIAIGSETPRVNSPTRHAESSTGRDDIVPHEDNISESPEETLEPFPDVREAIDDDIEDAGDCLESSQESRDTIESWSK
ncbi:hypothetical protein C8Q73DRAFT_665420 [Cubamyces lactineus]|nr:hypothetical protein C8Q73DRAFT_665420 [Cubamyces lactineus]